MNGDDHRAQRELIGAYVLGQLSGADLDAVRAHLESCRECRAEADDLTPLAASLRTVDPARLASAPEPPTELGERVIRQLRQEQRAANRNRLIRRAGVGVLAAAALAIAFTLGGVLRPGQPAGPPVQPLALTLAGGVQADAGLVRHTWGTELRLEASGLRDGDPYAVSFVTDSGVRVSAGSFLGTGTRPLVCSVNAAVALDDAARVVITDRGGTVVMDGDI